MIVRTHAGCMWTRPELCVSVNHTAQGTMSHFEKCQKSQCHPNTHACIWQHVTTTPHAQSRSSYYSASTRPVPAGFRIQAISVICLRCYDGHRSVTSTTIGVLVKFITLIIVITIHSMAGPKHHLRCLQFLLQRCHCGLQGTSVSLRGVHPLLSSTQLLSQRADLSIGLIYDYIQLVDACLCGKRNT